MVSNHYLEHLESARVALKTKTKGEKHKSKRHIDERLLPITLNKQCFLFQRKAMWGNAPKVIKDLWKARKE